MTQLPPSKHSSSGSVEVDLNFIVHQADGTAPWVDTTDSAIHEQKTHCVHVSDVRGHENDHSLEKDAFTTLRQVTSQASYSTFDSESEIRDIYYPEVEQLILNNVEGAHRVVILGHGLRKAGREEHRQPILYVHSDHTSTAAREFVQEHIEPEQQDELLQERYRIFSVWRPLNGPVQSTPLTFASGASLETKDLYPVELRYPDKDPAYFTGVAFNPQQNWLYWSDMTNDERLILQCTNSKAELIRAPHSAFHHPGAPAASKARESIEVRALVFG